MKKKSTRKPVKATKKFASAKKAKTNKKTSPRRARRTPKTAVKTTVTTVTTVVTGATPVPPVEGRSTLISFLLDESGSMQGRAGSTMTGFNEYIKTLRKNGENALFTFTKFNTERTEIVYKGVPLTSVGELNYTNYNPNHGTPLFDAVGRTIAALDAEYASFPANKKPAVIVAIMTDGEENSSREFTQQRIAELIAAREKQGWDFIYLGADHNAFKAAENLGIKIGLGNTMQYSQVNVVGTFAATANAHSRYTKQATRGVVIPREDLFLSGERTVLSSSVALDSSAVDSLLKADDQVGSVTGTLPEGAVTK